MLVNNFNFLPMLKLFTNIYWRQPHLFIFVGEGELYKHKIIPNKIYCTKGSEKRNCLQMSDLVVKQLENNCEKICKKCGDVTKLQRIMGRIRRIWTQNNAAENILRATEKLCIFFTATPYWHLNCRLSYGSLNAINGIHRYDSEKWMRNIFSKIFVMGYS